jgi:hypothetical protein
MLGMDETVWIDRGIAVAMCALASTGRDGAYERCK